MKTVLLAIGMIFCGAFWVGCDSEEGPAAPAPGSTKALPALGADRSRDESIDMEQAADEMVQDAEREVKQIAEKASDEVVMQAKAFTDEAESVASGLIADADVERALDATGLSLPQFLSSAGKKLGEQESQIATLKSLGGTFGNADLDKLIAAASDKLTEAQDLYKQLKTVTGAGDLQAMMTQLTDAMDQVGQLSQEALDKVESIKNATQDVEMPWK